jgi:signal recognition particle subunit SEC65
MQTKSIEKAFKDLGIKEEVFPDYENPYEFSNKFDICSIVNENKKYYFDKAELSENEKKIMNG